MVKKSQSDENKTTEKKVPESKNSEKKFSQRDNRIIVFHLLYAMDSFDYDVSLESVAENISKGFDVQIDFSDELLKKVASIVEERNIIDEEIKPLLANWRLDRVGCVTKLILRLAIWELKHTDIAPSIIINEAIELAKCFAEQDAYKFINGILDKWLLKYQPERVPKEEEKTEKQSKKEKKSKEKSVIDLNNAENDELNEEE